MGDGRRAQDRRRGAVGDGLLMVGGGKRLSLPSQEKCRVKPGNACEGGDAKEKVGLLS